MYDLVLYGGLVADGICDNPYPAAVCVKNGLIVRITTDDIPDGVRRLNVSGKIVAPGFIDVHSHSDGSPLVGYLTESKLAQGVTTEITGNCGKSSIPATLETLEELHDTMQTDLQLPLYGAKVARISITDYAADVEKIGAIGNYGMLVGHSSLRYAVMGPVDRDPTPEELETLKSMLERELTRGAFGMSLGLIYPPSAFSSRDELVELAKVLKKHNAVLAVHMRNEGNKVFESTDEMLSIAKESGVHLQISHLKLMGKPQWGRSSELLKKIEKAQAEGVNVTCDQYPFTASSTSLTAVLPHWAHDGGSKALLNRLRNPTEQLKQEIAQKVEERGGAHTILVVSTNSVYPEYEGKFVNEVAEALGLNPIDTIIKLLVDAELVAKGIFFCIDEGDMLNIMKKEYVCVGSDGYAYSYEKKYTPNNPHPRSFGTFPKFFQTVREHNLMPIGEAVRKVSSLPAKWFGINDRGFLKEGLAADITVFDPEKIENLSTYTCSKVRPKGIDYVIVNGEIAMDHGNLCQCHAGQVLLKK